VSRVPFKIEINRWLCDELDAVRKMYETRDFSGLMAAVERMQIHANSMESAIHSYHHIKYKLYNKLTDEEVSDKEYREISKETLKAIRDTEDDD
jgi:hypothetical protein